MKLRKLFLLGMIFLFLAGCGEKEDDIIKIGAILPLTGDAAVYGQNMKKGMDLALEQWNRNDIKFQIVYRDSKADPSQAVTSFQRLLNIEEIKALIGPFTSSEVLAIAPIAERNKIVVLAPTATSPKITNAGDYIFRIVPSDNYEGSVAAKFLYNDMNFKKIAAIFINNDYGVGLKNVFEKKYRELGGEITVSETYDPNTTNFRNLILKIKKTNAQAVYMVGLKEMGYILKQARELGLNTQFFSTGLMESNDILSIAKNAANGVLYTYPTFQIEKPDSVLKSFIEAFKLKYITNPDVLAAFGYDAVNILLTAFTADGNIKDNLYKIKNFHGTTGEMTFDKNGDVEKTFGVKKIDDGKFEWYLYSFN